MARLGTVLTELLGTTGAQYAAVVDGRTSKVLAEVGGEGRGKERTGAVTGLAMNAGALVEGLDGDVLHDVTLSTGRTFAVLRALRGPGGGRLVLHVVLRRGRGTVAATRREMESTALHRRILDAVASDLVPEPRRPVALPRRAAGAQVAGPPPPAAEPAPRVGPPTVLAQRWVATSDAAPRAQRPAPPAVTGSARRPQRHDRPAPESGGTSVRRMTWETSSSR
ncbi:MAG TPA: hypothetical protein VM367_03430 [Pseudonocardia sp.]|nr:hypothetical protein [Pseudonocardia sp.]